MPHQLYCPPCDRVITMDFAHEAAGRVCPGCATPAKALWKSKAAFEATKEKAAATETLLPQTAVPEAPAAEQQASEPEENEDEGRGRKRRAK